MIFRYLNTNAVQILSINRDESPITIREIHLFGAGVTGLILAVARWQARVLFTDNPFAFRFSQLHTTSPIKAVGRTVWWGWKAQRWIVESVSRTILILMLFLFPLILMAYYLYVTFFEGKPFPFDMSLLSLISVVRATLSTSICGLMLFAGYLLDLLESLKKNLSESARELANALIGTMVKWVLRTTKVDRIYPFG